MFKYQEKDLHAGKKIFFYGSSNLNKIRFSVSEDPVKWHSHLFIYEFNSKHVLCVY